MSEPVLSSFPETADVETSSEGYAQRFAGPVGAWFLRVQEAITLQMLAPYPGATLLDVGGGHGQLAPALVDAGYHVTVLGSSPLCSRRIQSLVDNGRCAFRVGDVLSLPYPDQAFDVVVSYRLLAHVNRWREFLFELTRVARQAVIIDYPTTRSLNHWAPHLFSLKKGVEGNTRSFACFADRELQETFCGLGFSPVERSPEFFLPMALHRGLDLVQFSLAAEKVSGALGLTRLFGSPVILKTVRQMRER